MLWLLTAAVVAQVTVDASGDCVDADRVRSRLETVLEDSGDEQLGVEIGVEPDAGAYLVTIRVSSSGGEVLMVRTYERVAPDDCGGIVDLLELVLRQFLRDLPAMRLPVGEAPQSLPSFPTPRTTEPEPSPTNRRGVTIVYTPWEPEPPEVGVRANVLTGPELDGSGAWGAGGEITGILALGPERHKLVILASQRILWWQGSLSSTTLLGVGWSFRSSRIRAGLEVRTGLRIGDGALTGRSELLGWLATPVGPVSIGPMALVAPARRTFLPEAGPEPPVLLLGVVGVVGVWSEKR